MKKNKAYTETEQLSRRRNCHYTVRIDLHTNDGSQKNYNLQITFKGSDLLECRAKAVACFSEKEKEIRELTEFEGLPLVADYSEANEPTSTANVDIEFCNDNKDGHSVTLDPMWNKENLLSDITDEYYSLLSLGYNPDEISIIKFEGLTDDEVKSAYRVVQNTRSKML